MWDKKNTGNFNTEVEESQFDHYASPMTDFRNKSLSYSEHSPSRAFGGRQAYKSITELNYPIMPSIVNYVIEQWELRLNKRLCIIREFSYNI